MEGAQGARAQGLPPVNTVGIAEPFRWLADGWRDLWAAPLPCLLYGLAVTALSVGLLVLIVATNIAFWVLALTCGFVFIAPMLAMGLYEAGRLIEQGERPRFSQMLCVCAAVRTDVAYLGLALLLIYIFWGRAAQLVYGLSTYTLHTTIPEFFAFAVGTEDGLNMLMAGSIVGGALAFLTYALVVVSAPMLLDQKTGVFAATATSVRAVSTNLPAMVLWALIIVVLLALSAATGFIALIVVFPWLGLASWRAYRGLVRDGAGPRVAAPAA